MKRKNNYYYTENEPRPHFQTNNSASAHRLHLLYYGIIRLAADMGLGIEGIKDRLSRLRPVSEDDTVGLIKKS